MPEIWKNRIMYTYCDEDPGFIDLKEEIEDIIPDIRYYSSYNFVGERIDGYQEPLALMSKEAALKLKEAADEFRKDGYLIKVYDAYRPQIAVDHFIRWASDPDDERMKEYFYPEVNKDELFEKGYIAQHSSHSRGSTIDLTLYDIENKMDIDVGSCFDYFGEISHANYKGISDEQYRNRIYLKKVMMKHDFEGIEEEWWHFTLKDEPYPDTYFTFPVKKR